MDQAASRTTVASGQREPVLQRRAASAEEINAAYWAMCAARKPAHLRIPLDGPSDYQRGCFTDENAEHSTHYVRNGSMG